eukprot:CAMPEP_0176430720 /NCGR_PEP_ID=MMETSP0127-20121128/14408_1 /TAXON_ID=938130 /ORGANISM="Platyophrya macrostoma, Strain WH" /LENGTH=152 /DNA_ID=CAMNT_0017812637 /DNA_START=21 /DNA_END=476 /DNA_ORIENTATION=-
MKHILSFILISALVFAASAQEDTPITDASLFLEGFTARLNITEPGLEICRASLENTTYAYRDAMELLEAAEDGDAIERAVGDFGYKLAHSLRVCSKFYKGMSNLFMTVGKDILNINTTEIFNRIMMNMFNLNMKYKASQAAYDQGDFKTMGQ